jgi:hypothetical protein
VIFGTHLGIHREKMKQKNEGHFEKWREHFVFQYTSQKVEQKFSLNKICTKIIIIMSRFHLCTMIFMREPDPHGY